LATGTEIDTAVIGTTRSDGGKTGIQALDDDVLNISVAIAPGVGVGDSDAIQNALITLAEKTQAFLACVSPPLLSSPSVQKVIDWSNGFSIFRTAALNSSYAAVYWPWLKVFSTYDGVDKWMAPEIFAARQIVYTDAVADPWFAPAGYVRGRLTKPLDTEVTLNQGDRDALYSPGNIINPVTKFPAQGIVIFGQRTAQREPTALDRINIRRMMIVIRKTILAATRRLVFEPNDPITWARVEGILNPLFDDIRQRRGITEFKVICDSTTNTPLRVDRNEMWTKVLIKPTKTAEVVVFELNLMSQSASLT
jgi:phage tail sheath protein FI